MFFHLGGVFFNVFLQLINDELTCQVSSDWPLNTVVQQA